MSDLRVLLAISGPISVGKTSVAQLLVNGEGFRRIVTGSYLLAEAARRSLAQDRPTLQQLGDALDVESDCRWVLTHVVSPSIMSAPMAERWLLDAVRKSQQLAHLRRALSDFVVHTHLTASEAFLRDRYENRQRAGADYCQNLPYTQAVDHPNEVASRSLIEIADLVVDVETKTPSAIVNEIVNHCRKTGRI